MYLALIPQFIRPGAGNVALQGFALGGVQISLSMIVNSTLIIVAGGVAGFLASRPSWTLWQRRITGTLLERSGSRSRSRSPLAPGSRPGQPPYQVTVAGFDCEVGRRRPSGPGYRTTLKVRGDQVCEPSILQLGPTSSPPRLAAPQTQLRWQPPCAATVSHPSNPSRPDAGHRAGVE